MSIISEKYISDNGLWVTVPISDCILVDICELNGDQVIAVLRDDNRLLLLDDCGIGNNGFGDRNRDSLKTATEVYCPIDCISELEYATAKEAISDVTYNKVLEKDVRVVDSIAYNNYCNKYR